MRVNVVWPRQKTPVNKHICAQTLTTDSCEWGTAAPYFLLICTYYSEHTVLLYKQKSQGSGETTSGRTWLMLIFKSEFRNWSEEGIKTGRKLEYSSVGLSERFFSCSPPGLCPGGRLAEPTHDSVCYPQTSPLGTLRP